jgi:DNA-binding transcriptional LysR family regulator
MRELEEFFGVELKRRQGNRFAITEAGRRLAQLTRAHLAGLEDFRRDAKHLPRELTMAAGNSVLEWLILPKVVSFQQALPNTSLRFISERSGTIVSRLIDMTIDIGVVREDALRSPLRSKRLSAFGYSLFVPVHLAKGILPKNLKNRIAKIPIATSMGGQFREMLMNTAAQAEWRLNVAVSCSSFTQAACAMRSSACAAVLPDIAAPDITNSHVVQIALPFLRRKQRQLSVAWNPRLAEVRPLLLRAVDATYSQLGQLH